MITFWLCFVPLFIAVDALGILPIFIGLIEGLERSKVRKIIWQSVVTAMVVALIFLVVGKAIFAFIGITIADFMIAGGPFSLSFPCAIYLPMKDSGAPWAPDSLGSVPLGVPFNRWPCGSYNHDTSLRCVWDNSDYSGSNPQHTLCRGRILAL